MNNNCEPFYTKRIGKLLSEAGWCFEQPDLREDEIQGSFPTTTILRLYDLQHTNPITNMQIIL